MVRSFLTRFPSSLIGVVLLGPCLLICLACATPFPVENLEEGMTAEILRENFGEPVATNTVWDPPGAPGGWDFLRGTWTYDAESSWTYVDEERHWGRSAIFSSIMLPWHIVFTVVGSVGTVVGGGHDFPWDWAYVDRKPVVLHFEDGRLAGWEVIEPIHSSGGVTFNSFNSMGSMGSMDSSHHSKGHTHHHHGC